MNWCEACRSVDFKSLLRACIQYCQARQDAYYGNGDGIPPVPDGPPWHKHQDDIFKIKDSAQDCALCEIIFQAFERREVSDPELARGIPIVFRPVQNNVEVCYRLEGGLIPLCGLDIYMNGDMGKYFLGYKVRNRD